MLQGRLEGVALAFVNLPVSGWQGQVVILQKITKQCPHNVCLPWQVDVALCIHNKFGRATNQCWRLQERIVVHEVLIFW